MAGINHFVIVGNVTKDVELRQTAGGNPTATYAVAVDATRFDKDGTKHEGADFIPVTTYGKQAENDAKFLKKGATVAVTGKIHSWYNRQENKGGFNFEAEQVQYLRKPTPRDAADNSGSQDNHGEAPLPDDLDDWRRAYDNADDLSVKPTAPAAPKKPGKKTNK